MLKKKKKEKRVEKEKQIMRIFNYSNNIITRVSKFLNSRIPLHVI